MDTQDAIWYGEEQQPMLGETADTPAMPIGGNVAVPSLSAVPSRQLERLDSEQALSCFLLDSLPGTSQNATNEK